MAGTETLNLAGIGNPILGGSGLIRSAFRPSDDATILPFFIPANAMMAVELKRAATVLKTAGKLSFSKAMLERAASIEGGIREHAIVSHKKYGDVFAFEVDGYGSHILMDDANLPSLLSLPDIGFVDRTDDVYKNTRKMILEQSGNPYFLTGKEFSGIGGPHIGLRNAWPMSRLVQARTSDNDTEIMESISAVLNSSRMGLIHESINVDNVWDYTSRSPKTFQFRFLRSVLMFSRELVCLGLWRVLADHSRPRRKKASFNIRPRCKTIQDTGCLLSRYVLYQGR
jgi:meiotically up-regulated gene 157 (Mug157) protein